MECRESCTLDLVGSLLCCEPTPVEEIDDVDASLLRGERHHPEDVDVLDVKGWASYSEDVCYGSFFGRWGLVCVSRWFFLRQRFQLLSSHLTFHLYMCLSVCPYVCLLVSNYPSIYSLLPLYNLFHLHLESIQ